MSVLDLPSVSDVLNAMAPKNGSDQVLVSFIVPALNEEKHIGACLESIRRLEIPSSVSGIEIIVVDNYSSDRTVEISQTLGATIVKTAPGNPSRARNAGANAARGGWLAFVDADCQLASNWLTTCAACLMDNPQRVAFGGVFADPGPTSTWVERTWHEIVHALRIVGPNQVRWLTIQFLVCRAAFDRAGRFDESLITCEDCDLGYKLSEIGTLVIDSRTEATHLGESRSLTQLFRREAWRSRGNLRLALRRPLDWSNWLSLFLPPCLVLGFIVSIFAVGASIVWHWPIWPGSGLFVVTVFATALLTMRKSRPTNLLSFGRRMIVFATYLAGRTAGLFWPFQRVDR
jgi:glycosyltransferase involved in cell wall biosynthesis